MIRARSAVAAWVAGGLLVASLAACTGDGSSEARSTTTAAPSVVIETTTSTTEAPLVGKPLVVAEQGVSSFPDPYDITATLGGYGVVVENPNPDLLAAGVRVTTRVLDPAGAELLVDHALVNAVMPGQRMALGRTLIEPVEDPTSLAVEVQVSSWLRPDSAGAITASDVVTEPEPNGGAVTRFVLRSSLPQAEEGVDVTAVYRAADGRILGAESTVVATVAPNVDVPGQIRLLSPIPDLAATEIYVGRGVTAQTLG